MATLDRRYADYELVDLYCLPDEGSPLRAWSSSALTFLILVSIWTCAVLMATLIDLCEVGGSVKSSKFVAWFSLRVNYNKLMLVKGESQTDNKEVDEEKKQQTNGQNSKNNSTHLHIDLQFLNSFKALLMFWVINGHVMLLLIETARNMLDNDGLINGMMHFFIGATFGVDLFFMMTGFLTSYLLFDTGHAFKSKISTYVYLTFHRYWRLAPMYILAFWFSRSVVTYLGSGPLWDYSTADVTYRGLCATQSWWDPVTLTSNLHGLSEECMMTSWYISNDMQYWLVSPIFIYLLAQRPTHGWIAGIVTIFMSTKMRFDNAMEEPYVKYDELVQPRGDVYMRVTHDLADAYTRPHYRIGPYIIGLLAGHYIYMVKSRKWSCSLLPTFMSNSQTIAIRTPEILSEMPRFKSAENMGNDDFNFRRSLISWSGLILTITMAFSSYVIANYYPDSMLKHAKFMAALLYSIDHLVMSFSACLVVIGLCLGQWPGARKFLSHPNWTRLSKINYALLLLQCEAIYYQLFRYEIMPWAGTRELITITLNLLITLYPVSFLITLIFEYPLANIEKLLMPKAK